MGVADMNLLAREEAERRAPTCILRWLSLTLPCLFAWAPSTAAAQCQEGLVRSAFSARIDGDRGSVALDALMAGERLSLPVPTESFLVNECPDFFEDTLVTPTAGDVVVTPVTSELQFFDGGIDFRIVLDVATEFDMALQVCALPDAACQARMSGEALEVRGRVRLAVSECAPSIIIESFEVTEAPSSNELELDGCGIYDWLGEALFSWFEDSILDWAREELSLRVNSSASDWITSIIERIATEGVEAAGLRIVASPETLRVSQRELKVDFAMGVEPLISAPAKCELRGVDVSSSMTDAPLVPPSTGSAAFAISHAAVENLVDSAWRAGWLCLDSRDLGVELGEVLEELAPDVDVALLLEVPERPSVTLTGEDGVVGAALELPELRVGVSTFLPGAAPSLLTVKSGARLTADIRSDPTDNSLRLTPRELTAFGFSLETLSGPLVLDPQGLQQTMDVLVLPSFRDALEDLPLSGAFFAGDNLATEIVQLSVDERAIAAAFEIYLAPAGDETPPETRLAETPPSFVPPTFVLETSSFDDAPPQQQVRHRVYVDGVAESRLRVGRDIAVRDLPSGPHVVGLAAVDLSGNEDPTPVEITVTVDTRAPSLRLLSQPVGIIRETATVIRYAADDDWTPREALSVEFVVGQVSRTAEPDARIAVGTLPGGEPLVLEGLEEDRAYRVTLTVVDQAGNRSEQELAFAVDAEPTLDCSSSTPIPWAILLLVSIARRRRRARGR